MANKTFSKRLKRLIADKAISQTDLAKKARIERSELNRIVNGKRDPRPYEIGWLAAALEITVKELLDDVDIEPLEAFEEEVERGQAHACEVLTAERERDEAKAAYAALADKVHDMEDSWRAERRQLQGALAELRDDCTRRVADREDALVKREQELLDQIAVLNDKTTLLQRELHQAKLLAADRGRQIEQLQQEVANARGKAAGAALFGGLIGAALTGK